MYTEIPQTLQLLSSAISTASGKHSTPQNGCYLMKIKIEFKGGLKVGRIYTDTHSQSASQAVRRD